MTKKKQICHIVSSYCQTNVKWCDTKPSKKY